MRSKYFYGAGAIVAVALLSCLSLQMHAQAPLGSPSENSAFSVPQADVMQPAELNGVLRAGGEKPLVLQVGSRVLFDQAHIAGSEYAGPGSQSAGLQLLKKRVAKVPHEKQIVLYCGCCPWNRCPNVGPAFHLLQGLGFTNLKVLYIADNFGVDWADKGYLVEHSR